ncbi:MAG: YicC family protein [Gammaproteobacteria bacterium]|nr:YicC family protein [Gammaproteobacteria bacterium]
MTASMTAFARQQAQTNWGSLIWEIRSVNHRYLEISVWLPEVFRSMEGSVREVIRRKLDRGKVECQLRFRTNESVNDQLEINTPLVEQLIAANQKIQQQLDTETTFSTMDLLRWPGVIGQPQHDPSETESAALALFRKTLDDLVAARQREGADLEGFLRERVQSIRTIVNGLHISIPEILSAQQQSLLQRLEDLKVEMESARLGQEVALLISKADVEEELDRLVSHLEEVERVLTITGPKGRRLDFLMQELNREANTLSSKAVVAETTRDAVEIKVLIEQMREQVQNIE